MSERRRKTVVNFKNNDVYGSLISAIKEGNLESVKKLVPSHGLFYCKDSHGGYAFLCCAIKSGFVEIAKFLLEKGAKANCKSCGCSPLHFAMRLKPVDLDLVHLLLGKNAAIDALNDQKETPLHVAAKKGCVEIVRVLLENNASVTALSKDGSTPLLLAAEGGHEVIIQMPFEHTCTKVKDVKDSLPSVSSIEKRLKALLLHTAVKNGHKEFVKLFLNSGFDTNDEDEEGKTCLQHLVDQCKEEGKCVEIMRLLFASGARIKEASELLHTAVSKRLFEVCKILIENEADINAQNISGNTPLHLAVTVADWEKLECTRKATETARNEIIKLLLNNGADISVRTPDGLTAFHHAVTNERKEMVQIFLECGVNVDLRAKNDSTPLHLASKKGLEEIVKDLCENGANVDACKKNGFTPLYLAARANENSAVEILLDHGCDINAENNDGDIALSIAISEAKSDFDGNRYWRHYYRRRYRWNEDFTSYDYYDDSSNDPSDDDGTESDFSLCEYDTASTLKRHIHKLKAAGLHVSQDNLDLLSYMGRENLSFKQKCEEEVSRMASKMLSSELTLSDILKTSRNPTLARTKLLVRNLKSFDFNEFPSYASLLKNKFEMSKLRLELLLSGQKSLDILVKTSSKLNGQKCTILPVELLELIISFLSITELKSLVSCSKALKRQLCQ